MLCGVCVYVCMVCVCVFMCGVFVAWCVCSCVCLCVVWVLYGVYVGVSMCVICFVSMCVVLYVCLWHVCSHISECCRGCLFTYSMCVSVYLHFVVSGVSVCLTVHIFAVVFACVCVCVL